MIAPFDIFKTNQDGSLLWRGEATDLDDAKIRAQKLARLEKTEYIIFSQRTGNRIVVKAEAASSKPD